MHVSDLHAGPPFRPVVAAQVAREAHDLKPDLLVISGDLVQRADFAGQWRTIIDYIATLPEPRLVIPGNHDVPLFHVVDRVFRPLSTYERRISPDVNPVFERPGLQVVGGNTAYGLTIDGGYLGRRQQQKIEQIFKRAPADTCKIAVLHHHVINPPACEGRRKISNAVETMRLLDRCGVELLLCGHIHMSFVGNTRDALPDLTHGTIICQSGTTTSRRGKATELGKNSYNVIEIDEQVLKITNYLLADGAARFVPVAEYSFPRQR
jgi:3',5'-cyclic AMP phosphodiesterase CpdA